VEKPSNGTSDFGSQSNTNPSLREAQFQTQTNKLFTAFPEKVRMLFHLINEIKLPTSPFSLLYA